MTWLAMFCYVSICNIISHIVLCDPTSHNADHCRKGGANRSEEFVNTSLHVDHCQRGISLRVDHCQGGISSRIFIRCLL
jgi:hypothetical protein